MKMSVVLSQILLSMPVLHFANDQCCHFHSFLSISRSPATLAGQNCTNRIDSQDLQAVFVIGSGQYGEDKGDTLTRSKDATNGAPGIATNGTRFATIYRPYRLWRYKAFLDRSIRLGLRMTPSGGSPVPPPVPVQVVELLRGEILQTSERNPIAKGS